MELTTNPLTQLLAVRIDARVEALSQAMRRGGSTVTLDAELAHLLLLQKAARYTHPEQVQSLLHPITCIPTHVY